MTKDSRLQINAADKKQQQYSSEARNRLSDKRESEPKSWHRAKHCNGEKKHVPLQPI
jgi:hypothetical protein